MKLRPIDLKQIEADDTRIRAFKERMWNQEEKFDPFERFAIVALTSYVFAFALVVLGIIAWIKIWG